MTLTADQNYTAKSGDVITGAAGQETVTLNSGISRVTLDGRVEHVNLSGGLFDYNLQSQGQKVSINTGSFSTTLATIQTSTSGTHLAFADGSAVTLSLGAYGSAQIHYDTVQLLANRTTSVGNSDVTIKGGTGTETVKLGSGLYHASVDQNVENLVLARSWQDSSVQATGTHIQVHDGDSHTVVDWVVATGQTHALQFDNAEGTVSLGSNGEAVFTLTDMYLQPGDSYTADTDGVTVHSPNTLAWWFYDQPSVVTLSSGVHDIHIEAGIDTVVLPGNIGDYTYQDSDGELNVFNGSGQELASIQIPWSNTGVTLQFGDLDTQAVLTQQGIYVDDLPVSQTDPAPLNTPVITPEPGSTGSGSVGGFEYSLNLGNFGAYAGKIEAVLEKALDNISQYVSAQGVFDISVKPENVKSTVLAEAAPATVSTPASLASQLHDADTSSVFQVEGLTGADPNGKQADATVYINMNHIKSFNLDPEAAPGANQYDLTTILTHELIHSIGFNGYLSDPTSTDRSTFDQQISFVDGIPYFTGTEAQALYGNPVPLAPESRGDGSAYYHVDLPSGSDLMADSLGKGDVRSISSLDLAILDDIGLTIVGSLPITA
ncbi:MAG: hypothetical protein ACR2HF_10015 [Methylococcaceae bacterium]